MSVNFGTGKLPFTCWTRGPGIGNWASECFVTFGAGKWLSSCVHLVCFFNTPRIINALSHQVQTNGFPNVFSKYLWFWMPCHIFCSQMAFNCVHPVCFVKTPRVLNALSHLVQTNSFPPVFSQCVFSKHLGFECLVTCSAGKWRSSWVHLYSVFFQYLLDY